MPTVNDDLNSFYHFALIVRQQNSNSTIEQLLFQWRAAKERAEVNEAIRDGLREIESDGGKLANEFLAEMDAKYDLSMDS